PLKEHPKNLLDVVIGSGSIFPVFPSRHIDLFYNRQRSVDLIDGGFAHNSPIEAATLWYASHVFQVEASPEEDQHLGGLWRNSGVAYRHLFSQAQVGDAQARENSRAIVFTLRPTSTISLISFQYDAVYGSITRGYVDAVGSDERRRRAFRRQPKNP